MPKIRIDYNKTAMYDLRRHPKIVGFLESRGRAIVDAANATLPDDEDEGYAMSSRQGRKGPSPSGKKGKGYQGRWAVRVYTVTNHAKRSNAVNNTLVRLLGP